MVVSFRKLNKNDLTDRVRWFCDPKITEFFGSDIRNGTSIQMQRQWYNKMSSSKNRVDFVIIVDGKAVGNVGLVDINKIDLNAGLYIFIGEKNYWGRGVAQKALAFISKLGFKEINLHKIYLTVYSQNSRAIGCYRKFGFIEEGRHTEMVFIENCYQDEIFMSLINPNNC